jgi:hypothetical protein
MRISINPGYGHCERRNCYVSLEQTEGRCRDRHNCSDEECPLEKQFGRHRFGGAMGWLAASIGQPLGIGSKG